MRLFVYLVAGFDAGFDLMLSSLTTQMTMTVPGVGGQSCCPDLWEALVIGGQKETVLTLEFDFLNFVYAWIRGLVDV